MKNGLIVDQHGTKCYYLNDKLHRVDGPAEELVEGSKGWWVNGEIHREDGPAIEMADGTKFWLIHGKKHREDGPAVEAVNGSKYWWVNGKRHRVDGPAMEYLDGTQYWYLRDKQLIHPKEFKTMEDFFARLNTDEEYSLPWINDINGIIEVIKKPTPKQKRLHAMKWKI